MKKEELILKALSVLDSIKTKLTEGPKDITNLNEDVLAVFDKLCDKLKSKNCPSAFVAVAYHNAGIALYNQGKNHKVAVSLFKNASAVYKVHKQLDKMCKCLVLQAKTTISIYKDLIHTDLEKAIVGFQNAISLLSSIKIAGKIDPLILMSIRYEQAVAQTRLALCYRKELVDATVTDETGFIRAMEECISCWATVLLLMENEPTVSQQLDRRGLHDHLQVLADMFHVMGYHIEYIKTLKMMHQAPIHSKKDNFNGFGAHLSDVYCKLGYVGEAKKYLSKNNDDTNNDDDIRSTIAKSNLLIAKGVKYTETKEWGVLVTHITKTINQLKKEEKMTHSSAALNAECHYTLSKIYLTQGKSVDALACSLDALLLWMQLFRSVTTTENGEAKSKSRFDISSLVKVAQTSSTSIKANSGSSPSQWRFMLGLFDCIELTGKLYEAQGSIRQADYYFNKGLEMAEGAKVSYFTVRFLLELSNLARKRHQLEDSQQYLERAYTSIDSETTKSRFQLENIVSTLYQGDLLLRTIESHKQNESKRNTVEVLRYFEHARSLSEDLLKKQHFTKLVEKSNTHHNNEIETNNNDAIAIDGDNDRLNDDDCVPLMDIWARSSRRLSRMQFIEAKQQCINDISSIDTSLATLEEEYAHLITTLELCNNPTEQAEFYLDSAIMESWKGSLDLAKKRTPLADVDGNYRMRSLLWTIQTKKSAISASNRASLKSVQQNLEDAFIAQLPSNVPGIRNKICRELVSYYGLENPWKTSFYVDASLGITARHESLCVLQNQTSNITDSDDDDSDAGLLDALEALSLDDTPRYVQERYNHLKFESSLDASIEKYKRHVSLLPKNWQVVSLSLSNDEQFIFVSKVCSKWDEPLVMRFPLSWSESSLSENKTDNDLTQILDYFREIMVKSKEITKMAPSMKTKEQKKKWWASRHELDEKLGDFLPSLETSWFGAWRIILNGFIGDEETQESLDNLSIKVTQQFKKAQSKADINPHMVAMLIRGYIISSEKEMEIAIAWLLGFVSSPVINKTITENSTIEIFTKTQQKILSQCIKYVHNASEEFQSWKQTYYHPVILVLPKEIQHMPIDNFPTASIHPISRVPCLSFIATGLELSQNRIFQAEKTCYVLNPGNDLERTQKKFQTKFKAQKGWSGTIGTKPNKEDMMEALENHDLFVYCGHSAGEQYLTVEEAKKAKIHAVTLLMGCSSGLLKYDKHSDYEPNGMALAYLVGGCISVTANLWDVTDGDIDLFSETLLKSVAYSNKKRRDPVCLLSAVQQARTSCKLRFLNGASPVCYGIPINMQ